MNLCNDGLSGSIFDDGEHLFIEKVHEETDGGLGRKKLRAKYHFII